MEVGPGQRGSNTKASAKSRMLWPCLIEMLCEHPWELLYALAKDTPPVRQRWPHRVRIGAVPVRIGARR